MLEPGPRHHESTSLDEAVVVRSLLEAHLRQAAEVDVALRLKGRPSSTTLRCGNRTAIDHGRGRIGMSTCDLHRLAARLESKADLMKLSTICFLVGIPPASCGASLASPSRSMLPASPWKIATTRPSYRRRRNRSGSTLRNSGRGLRRLRRQMPRLRTISGLGDRPERHGDPASLAPDRHGVVASNVEDSKPAQRRLTIKSRWRGAHQGAGRGLHIKPLVFHARVEAGDVLAVAVEELGRDRSSVARSRSLAWLQRGCGTSGLTLAQKPYSSARAPPRSCPAARR